MDVDATVATTTTILLTTIHPTTIHLTTSSSGASATTTSPSGTGMAMCTERAGELTRQAGHGATPMEAALTLRGLRGSPTTPGHIKPVTIMENN